MPEATVETEERDWRRRSAGLNMGRAAIASIAKRYGLSWMDYLAQVEKQDRRCAICQQFLYKINIDHCHYTGKIRGLICTLCNFRLGDVDTGTRRATVAEALYLVSPSPFPHAKAQPSLVARDLEGIARKARLIEIRKNGPRVIRVRALRPGEDDVDPGVIIRRPDSEVQTRVVRVD